mgnify:FL=1
MHFTGAMMPMLRIYTHICGRMGVCHVGGMRSMHGEIHRWGKLTVNHKGN